MNTRDTMIELMTAEYRRLASIEPSHDAGSHPSSEVHERVGAAWAEWDKQVQAVKFVLSTNLLMKHLAEVSS